MRKASAYVGLVAMALASSASVAAAAPGKDAVIAPGAAYVALGSSFASGPNITTPADGKPDRCGRSADNYAHQLAHKRRLVLTDVSCSGATTQQVLHPWHELPAQLDALTPETKLVTITIGGNDVGLAGGMLTASCAASTASPSAYVARVCAGLRAAAANGTIPGAATGTPDEAAWARLAANLDTIAQAVRTRSPAARLVFVEYIRVLPGGALCAAVPLGADAADLARRTSARLATETAAAARRAGAGLVAADTLSRGHDACARDNWASPFTGPPGAPPFTPYHPNLAAMTAIAEALDRMLR